jgi:hypothetical protein
MLSFNTPRPRRAGFFLNLETKGDIKAKGHVFMEGFKVHHLGKEKIVVAIEQTGANDAKLYLTRVILVSILSLYFSFRMILSSTLKLLLMLVNYCYYNLLLGFMTLFKEEKLGPQ